MNQLLDPYTPSARPRSRKAHVGLSVREYNKVAGTIASVRQNRQSHHDQDTEQSFLAETSFVKAPLNSRVSSVSKGKAKQHDTLDRVPLDIQQALILEDLLYVLMGIEGTYITYSPEYSPEDDDPLAGIKFIVTPSLDKSLRDLVERILPLGTYYTSISSFIELRSHLDLGLVNHALCAAVRDMLKDYQTLLSQLEHAFNTSPTFSLQKLWFYVHPTVHTLSLIYNLVLELASYSAPSGSLSDLSSEGSSPSTSDAEEEARNEALGLGGAQLKALQSEFESGGKKSRRKGAAAADDETSEIPVKGGEVLAVIYERMQHHSGDPTAREVYGTLLRKAGSPYVEMVKGWVGQGRLEDPYDEFLVKERRDVDRKILESDYVDEYWEGRYTLRDGSTHSSKKGHQVGVPPPRSLGGRLPGGACVPPLLEGWKHKILLAGKYLNVIRECGIELTVVEGVVHPEQIEELFMDDEKFYTFLESAYTLANTRLLQLLLKDQQLIPRLRSLKRYFFLSQSTWLSAWLEAGTLEWRKPAITMVGERKKEGVSVSRLQHLLDLAVGADGPTVGVPLGGTMSTATTVASGLSTQSQESEDGKGAGQGQGQGDGFFKEEIKVGLSETGLYAFLLQVVSVTGVGDGLPGSGLNGLGEGGDKGKGREDKRKDGRGTEKEEKKSLNAIEALTLDYIVPFPLSLVISRKTILRYQLIFRFLLHLKYAEMGLSSMWADQKTWAPWRIRKSTIARKLATPAPTRPSSAASNPKGRTRSLSRARATPTPTPISRATSTSTLQSDGKPEVDNEDEFERWRRRVWLLRARMLSFVQQILAFATFEVLEPNWRKLEGKLLGTSGVSGVGGRGSGGVTTVDQLLRDHVDFLDTVLKECMLTSSKLLQAYSRLIVTCSTFAMYTSMFTKGAESAVEDWEAEMKGDDPSGESKSKRWDTLMKFEKNFNHWFNIFINCVQFFASSENVSLLPLVVRLNSIKTTGGPSSGATASGSGAA